MFKFFGEGDKISQTLIRTSNRSGSFDFKTDYFTFKTYICRPNIFKGETFTLGPGLFVVTEVFNIVVNDSDTNKAARCSRVIDVTKPVVSETKCTVDQLIFLSYMRLVNLHRLVL